MKIGNMEKGTRLGKGHRDKYGGNSAKNTTVQSALVIRICRDNLAPSCSRARILIVQSGRVQCNRQTCLIDADHRAPCKNGGYRGNFLRVTAWVFDSIRQVMEVAIIGI